MPDEEYMKVLDASDGEIHLFVEEEKRQCRPLSEIGECIVGDRHKPFIRLKDGLKEKEKYKNTYVTSSWAVPISGTQISGLFLSMKIKDAGILKFDLPIYHALILEWLKLLVEAEGDIVIFDGSQPTVMVRVTLDIPKKLLKDTYFKEVVQELPDRRINGSI